LLFVERLVKRLSVLFSIISGGKRFCIVVLLLLFNHEGHKGAKGFVIFIVIIVEIFTGKSKYGLQALTNGI